MLEGEKSFIVLFDRLQADAYSLEDPGYFSTCNLNKQCQELFSGYEMKLNVHALSQLLKTLNLQNKIYNLKLM